MARTDSQQYRKPQRSLSLLLVLCAFALQVVFLSAHQMLEHHIWHAEQQHESVALADDCLPHHESESDFDHDHDHDHEDHPIPHSASEHGCELFVLRTQTPPKLSTELEALPVFDCRLLLPPAITPGFVDATPMPRPSAVHRRVLGSRGPPAAV